MTTMPTAELSLPRLSEDLQVALKQWSDPGDVIPALADLHLFHQALQQTHGNAYAALTWVLEAGLRALEAESAKRAAALRLRFVENRTVFDAANQLNMAESSFYNLQRAAMQRLAELLYAQERALRTSAQLALTQRLEAPTYTELVGVEQSVATLLDQMRRPAAPWLLALEGMGGIGKTALAHTLMRQLLSQLAPFVGIGWVTARQSHYDLAGAIVTAPQPALTSEALIAALWQQLLAHNTPAATLTYDQKLHMLHSHLKQQPHVIVIDNLETLLDVESLLPLLQMLANPTKFLLTARLRFGGGVGIYHFTVPPLCEADALQLVRQEALFSNLVHLATADDETLRPIYATVGGNPLALRLIVGQTHVHALSTILEDLQRARGAKVEQLYTYLYRWAWERLDEPARMTWLAMPLVTEANATLAYLTQVTALPLQTLRLALEHLVRLNLVYCHSDLLEPRYTIHGLTRTFLQEQIAQWL